jgi:hypothetical protein
MWVFCCSKVCKNGLICSTVIKQCIIHMQESQPPRSHPYQWYLEDGKGWFPLGESCSDDWCFWCQWSWGITCPMCISLHLGYHHPALLVHRVHRMGVIMAQHLLGAIPYSFLGSQLKLSQAVFLGGIPVDSLFHDAPLQAYKSAGLAALSPWWSWFQAGSNSYHSQPCWLPNCCLCSL